MPRLRVNYSVALGTQGDQIALGIIACVAPALDMMDLDPMQGAASLAAPAISHPIFMGHS